MSNDINLKPLIRFIFAIILICITPFLISKFLKTSNKVEKPYDIMQNKQQVENIINDYIKNNMSVILEYITDEYYTKHQEYKSNDKIRIGWIARYSNNQFVIFFTNMEILPLFICAKLRVTINLASSF